MRVLVCLVFLGGLIGGQFAKPCPIENSENGWRTLVDRTHRFCFQYPSQYRRIADLPKNRRGPGTGYNIIGRFKTEFPRRASDEDRHEALIEIWLSKAPFDLKRLVSEAPTGVIEPPSAVRAGPNLFYEYGAGGGGVSYPDRYYFNLHGTTLELVFDGPYRESKSPSPETKEVERKLLASFRAF